MRLALRLREHPVQLRDKRRDRRLGGLPTGPDVGQHRIEYRDPLVWLDDVCARAVRTTFFKMFKDGLIYRGKRLVNWDVQLQTAVADDEVYHEEVSGHLWHIKYPVEASDVFLEVATTRPETMLGDTAVAVHPDDPRYRHLIGRHSSGADRHPGKAISAVDRCCGNDTDQPRSRSRGSNSVSSGCGRDVPFAGRRSPS